MEKKQLEEIKKMSEKAKKVLAEKRKCIEKQLEELRKTLLVFKALDELLEENPDFKRLFESILKELSLKEKAVKQDNP